MKEKAIDCTYWWCYRYRRKIDLPRAKHPAVLDVRRFVNPACRTRLLCRVCLWVHPPSDTTTPAVLGVGTCRRVPLHACCYQVLMSCQVWHPHIPPSLKKTHVPLPHAASRNGSSTSRRSPANQHREGWTPARLATKVTPPPVADQGGEGRIERLPIGLCLAAHAGGSGERRGSWGWLGFR
jgi:hypothetical protein